MPESAKFLIIICSFIMLLCVIKMIKSGHFIKCFIISALSGSGSLIAINTVSYITGLHLSINWFSLPFCCLTGISGSIFLALLNLLKLHI